MKSNKLFFWACDYNQNSGEGRLGRLFINEYKKKSKKKPVIIKSLKLKILNYKYISPFIGIFYAWLYFFKGKKFLFLNYIPYWNFLIFILLPPNSEIGPITGGAKFSKYSNDFKIRKFIFPIFYNLSNLILKYRFKKLFFSTDLLKKYLSKDIIKKSEFNFVFREIKKRRKKVKKKIKFLFYFRKHNNKNYEFICDLIKKFKLKNNIVHVIGDRLNLQGVKNYGTVSYKKAINLLEITKYSFATSENIFSFFTIDCINNNVKILVNSKSYKYINKYKKNFIKFNFTKTNIKKLI